MKLSLVAVSWASFGVALLFLIVLTLFESTLLGISPRVERLISLIGLVLPAVIGAALGVLSLRRREGRTGVAITGIMVNTLFSLFHLAVILFAG
jgi:hypothetical protein